MMNDYIVPIVLATDDNFAPYCSVAIASIIKNSNVRNKYDIYVFYDNLSETNIGKLQSMAKNNISIKCVSVSALMDKTILYSAGRFSITTYLRLYIAEMLTQYEKVIYLDCDIIVQTDMANFLMIDLANELLGGVVVFRGYPEEIKGKERYLNENLGISPEHYINAGVLLINTAAFRKENIYQKCMDTLKEKRNFKWFDQDVLNYVCKGRIKYLDSKWNTYYRYLERDLISMDNPLQFYVLHYLDQGKPWSNPFIPSYIYFIEYIRLSPYYEVLHQNLIQQNISREKTSMEHPEMLVLNMYEDGALGLRYIIRYVIAWIKYKLHRKGREK